MKIVQTFWSKPLLQGATQTFYQRGDTGGWLDRKNYYVSWALSCLQLCKFYDQVELVTDEVGKEILIDRLKLPYTNVVVTLDKLNHFHTDLWALGKIHSYGIQREPFIHVDSDIYIWDKFGIEHGDLISQNFEKGYFYNEILKNFSTHFSYFPECLASQINNEHMVHSINAGIFGGSNWPFIQEYTRQAYHFVERNLVQLPMIEIAKFNVLFEQILFFYLAAEKNLEITPLVNDTFSTYGKWIVNFDGVPESTKFIHAIGGHKKDVAVNEHICNHLQTDYPKHFELVNRLF